MNRRSFLRSLGVLLVAPATLVRAAATAKPNRIVNPDMALDCRTAPTMTEMFGSEAMARYDKEMALHFSNGNRIMCSPLNEGQPLRGYRADVMMIDDANWLPSQMSDEEFQGYMDHQRRILRNIAIKARQYGQHRFLP